MVVVMGCTRMKLVLTSFVVLVQVSVWHQVDSQQAVSTCRLCERQPTACRRIAGLYTVTVLSKGTYNPVVEIPPQACSINITELAPSKNYLAVKTDRGDNIVNGYWSVGSTGTFRGVGTSFEYNRAVDNCPGECVTSEGPTNRRIIVQLLYYDKNPGIAYSFILPNDVPFLPFDEVAPKVESRSRSHRHRGGHGNRHNRQGPRPTAAASEPYVSGGRQSASTSQIEEPRRPVTPQRRPGATAATNRDLLDARVPSYRGSSYGSHTLGGRGQSYTFQGSGGGSNANGNIDSGSNPSIVPSSPSIITGGQYTPSRGSVIRNRAGYDPNLRRGTGVGVGDAYGSRPEVPVTSGRRPTFVRRPTHRRRQPTSAAWNQNRQYISAYDNNNNNNNRESSRGYQTLASSSQSGLLDRTFSRALDTDNRLPTFERPVELRPALSIGTGHGGNEYEWTISGLTQCSRTCGGGTQETEVVCILTSSGTQVVVTPDNCQNALKPRVQRVSCNNDPCPPGWETEEWSECSVTCGGGTQSRRIECRQRFSKTLELSVSASQCDQQQKPAVAQQCNNDPCAMWKEGEWGECSSECGGGERQRSIECTDGLGVQIPDHYCAGEKPVDKEQCNTQACNTQWWHTHWSNQCSTDCGTGVTTRRLVCADRSGRPLDDSACVSNHRPRHRKRCESSAGCGSMWFTGTWSQCSESCGEGVRTRQVMCMKRDDVRGPLTVVEDDQCPADTKPSLEESCSNTACGSQYYVNAWGQCSVTCGTGVKTRQAKCLDENQQPSWTCDRSHAPNLRETCQLSPCPTERQEAKERPPQTSRSVIISNRRLESTYIAPTQEEEKEPEAAIVDSSNTNAIDNTRAVDNTHAIDNTRVIGNTQVVSNTRGIGNTRFGNRHIISNRRDNVQALNTNARTNTDKYKNKRNNDDDDHGKFVSRNNNNQRVSGGGRQNSVEQTRREREKMPADPKTIDGDCKNSFWNCRLVVQARMCTFSYYRKACCQACRKVV